MKPGYLGVETHSNRAGLVRLTLDQRLPDIDAGTRAGRRTRFLARFNDADAALMHTHELLKRRLLDPDIHLYRTSFQRAIAAVQSLDLGHRDVYIDPGLSSTENAEIASLTERFRNDRRRWDRFFQAIGYIGLGLLLFNLLAFSLA